MRRVTINRYTIYEDGRIYSTWNGKFLKHSLLAGYPRVVFYINKKPASKHIHRLLAEYFIPNPENKPQINHIDGNRLNYKLDNLEWCTQSENQIHRYRVLGKTNQGWGTTRPLVDRRKICENCKQEFMYKRKATRFCSNSCTSKWRIKKYPHTIERERDPINGRLKAIKLFETGVLKK